jgi:hypothetical protein
MEQEEGSNVFIYVSSQIHSLGSWNHGCWASVLFVEPEKHIEAPGWPPRALLFAGLTAWLTMRMRRILALMLSRCDARHLDRMTVTRFGMPQSPVSASDYWYGGHWQSPPPRETCLGQYSSSRC